MVDIVKMDNYIKQIKSMYNACAKNFSQYLEDHDMAAYNERSAGIKTQFGGSEDVVNLLFWFAPKVQAVHDRWRNEHGK